MPVLIEGVFARPRLLSLMQDFTVFGDTPGGIAKIIAGYHQFHAVRAAIEHVVAASRADSPANIQGKGGVVWHTPNGLVGGLQWALFVAAWLFLPMPNGL